MTDATKLAACPLCGDRMHVSDSGMFGHTDSNADCLLAKLAWGDEPRFVAAWNTRVTPASAEPEIGVGEMLPGLAHIANFLNALDTEGMTANEVRSAIYSECLEPGCKSTLRTRDAGADALRAEKAEALLREARTNLVGNIAIILGGRVSGEVDKACGRLNEILARIDAHLAGEPGQGDEA